MFVAKRLERSPKMLIVSFFFYFVCAGLAITGSAKLLSSFADVPLLDQTEAVTGMSYRWLFRVAASLEFLTLYGVVRLRSPLPKALMTMALFNTFFVYRIVRIVFGLQPTGCPCFGFLTDWTGIDRHTVDLLLGVYLFTVEIGCVAVLFLFASREASADGTA